MMGAGVSNSRASSRADVSTRPNQEQDKPAKPTSKDDDHPKSENTATSQDNQKEDNQKQDSKKQDSKTVDSKKEDSKKEDSKKEDSKKEDSKKEDSKKAAGSSKEKNPDKQESKVKKDSKKKEKESSSEIDVMISYSHADTDAMKQIKDGLEAAGLKVWVDITGLKAGVDFLSKIGQAIIDGKMFVQLLTTSSIKSKYCQDELALAYVSNKPIFPVGLQKPSALFPIMDTGMKLQLARFNWNVFNDGDSFKEDLASLVDKLIEFKESGTLTTSLETQKSEEHKGNTRTNVNRYRQKKTSFDVKTEIGDSESRQAVEALTQQETIDFWEKNFKNKTSVPWIEFSDTFKKQYKKNLTLLFSESDQDWLERIIHRELVADDEDDSVIKKEGYTDFCTVDEELKSFWDRIQDQAVESYTMKEVFDMNSSVRVEAIENLGKFRSKAVVEALMDLLHDKDNNIRAVAAISLARTGEDSPHVIKELMKCLNDSDRLVREGACLALGHLKAYQAVQKILHLWRNDFISSVREAAQVALELIGGTEANKAMYITKVLSEEIRMLTKE